MSLFGKNIKKIRGIKSLSQQSFAELFDLKRATLGAYEEQRSEPKIDTIIQIAQHFNIPIDDLLTKELTVNQLLKFKGELTLDTEGTLLENFVNVPCIVNYNRKEFIKNLGSSKFVSTMPYVRLPLSSKQKYMAYTINNLEMSSYEKGLFPKDVVIGKKVELTKLNAIKDNSLVLILTDKDLILRNLVHREGKLVLSAAHPNIDEIVIASEEIKTLWAIQYVFYKRVPDFKQINWEDRINKLEDKLFSNKK